MPGFFIYVDMAVRVFSGVFMNRDKDAYVLLADFITKN